MDAFELYCVALALCYHEARNVRHLIHRGYLGSTKQWQKIRTLPKNRYDAWRAVLPVMCRAKATSSVIDASEVFLKQFDVAIDDLKLMFENENWTHYRLSGGNAWAHIATEVICLGDSLRLQNQAGISKHFARLKVARHNNGSLLDKFEELSRKA